MSEHVTIIVKRDEECEDVHPQLIAEDVLRTDIIGLEWEAHDGDMKRQRDELMAVLDRIASWGEGEDITPAFDEPHSASIARAAIAKVREG